MINSGLTAARTVWGAELCWRPRQRSWRCSGHLGALQGMQWQRLCRQITPSPAGGGGVGGARVAWRACKTRPGAPQRRALRAPLRPPRRMSGEPVELIKYNVESGQFEVGARATAVLRSVKGPLAVVAVCGRARQGKSFILNQLLQTSGGFTVGSTHRPCTKGLWMWSTPVKRQAIDGTDYHLVRSGGHGAAHPQNTACTHNKNAAPPQPASLAAMAPSTHHHPTSHHGNAWHRCPGAVLACRLGMLLSTHGTPGCCSAHTARRLGLQVLLDTEGIDAYDQTAQYSTQIFSLAVLLSSLFVYNQASRGRRRLARSRRMGRPRTPPASACARAAPQQTRRHTRRAALSRWARPWRPPARSWPADGRHR